MNTLTRWDPFKGLDELQGRLATVFGRLPVRFEPELRETMTLAEWSPLVDVVEDEKEYLIKAELPEVNKEDVKVTVNEDVITISGKRRKEAEQQDEKVHRVESFYGNFSRSFRLPEDADIAAIQAESRNGVLKVRVPKSPAPKPRTVEVQVN